MEQLSKIYSFESDKNQYIYSGYTGLLIENNSRIRDFLFNNKEDNELKNYIYGNTSKNKQMPYESFLSSITVFCTNFCNLSCSYCYHKENNFTFSENMNVGLFIETVEYMLQNMKYGEYVNIFFFGGEPLLNFSFIKESVSLLENLEEKYSTKFTYSLTTNGTVFRDEIIDFILEKQIGLMISIDGKKEVHDKTRKFINGKGSYDTIIKNVQEISKYMRVPARVTITDLNTDLIELYEELIEKGFSSVTIAVVSTKDNKFDFEAEKETLSIRLREMADYTFKKLSNKELIPFTNYANSLKKIHKGLKSYHPCSSLKGSYTLSAKGDFYLCHRFNNLDEYTFGNFANGLDKKRVEDFVINHSIVNRNNSCSNCWAASLCGGLCYHAAYTENNNTRDINNLECFFNKEVIKNSLYIYSLLDEEIRETLDNWERG